MGNEPLGSNVAAIARSTSSTGMAWKARVILYLTPELTAVREPAYSDRSP